MFQAFGFFNILDLYEVEQSKQEFVDTTETQVQLLQAYESREQEVNVFRETKAEMHAALEKEEAEVKEFEIKLDVLVKEDEELTVEVGKSEGWKHKKTKEEELEKLM